MTKSLRQMPDHAALEQLRPAGFSPGASPPSNAMFKSCADNENDAILKLRVRCGLQSFHSWNFFYENRYFLETFIRIQQTL
jgi:hypothetical protein